MHWERALGLGLALAALVIWSLYCRRLALAERAAAQPQAGGAAAPTALPGSDDTGC